MGFALRIGSTLVTADTAAEAAELVRALGETTVAPVKRQQGTGTILETPAGYQIRLRTGPGRRINRGGFKSRSEAEAALEKLVDSGIAPPLKRHRRAPESSVDDDAIEESLHAPIFPTWQSDPPTIGDGRYETPTAKSGEAGPARAGGDEGAGATPVAVSPAAATADQPDAPAPGELEENRSRPPRRGSVFKRNDGFLLMIVVDGKQNRRGFFKTREAAERAQEETYQARLRGDPLPIYIWRTCRRCGEVGHTAMSCKAVNPQHPPQKPRKYPPYIRPPGRTVHGSPEHRQKASEAGKTMWTERRAAGTPADEWPRQETREATKAYWARYRIEHATPKAEPSCTENAEPVQLHSEPQDIDGLARVIQERAEPAESIDDLLDDGGGSDLTDLVDVPDAEPTAIPDVDLNVECHACGQRGHRSNYEGCPLNSTKGGPRPAVPNRTTLIPDRALRVRSRSVRERQLTRTEKSELIEYPDDVERPLTREDCMSMPRPCPFVSCSHHLYLDVNPESGTLKLNFPHLQVWEMAETCSLDVADRGGITLEEIGAILNLTRERIRQVEVKGLRQMQDGAYELGVSPEPRNTGGKHK